MPPSSILTLRLNETVKSSEQRECRESGECAEGEALCDEARIRAVFAETRGRIEGEHVVREVGTRFQH